MNDRVRFGCEVDENDGEYCGGKVEKSSGERLVGMAVENVEECYEGKNEEYCWEGCGVEGEENGEECCEGKNVENRGER